MIIKSLFGIETRAARPRRQVRLRGSAWDRLRAWPTHRRRSSVPCGHKRRNGAPARRIPRRSSVEMLIENVASCGLATSSARRYGSFLSAGAFGRAGRQTSDFARLGDAREPFRPGLEGRRPDAGFRAASEFRQELYRSYMVDRPEAPVEVGGRLAPGVDEGAVARQEETEAPPTLTEHTTSKAMMRAPAAHAFAAAPAPAPTWRRRHPYELRRRGGNRRRRGRADPSFVPHSVPRQRRRRPHSLATSCRRPRAGVRVAFYDPSSTLAIR